MMLRRSKDNIGLLYVVFAPIVIGPFFASLLSPHIHDDTVHGTVEPGYEQVLEAFRRNFGEGLERDGAAVAVYHRGKLVVNLWGGYADRESDVAWERNTRTVLFSATKAISALCVAVLVDRGLLSYEDRLVDFWPEYGVFGKENTTVEDVLSHKAGLPYLEEDISFEEMKDYALIRRKLERSRPVWEPGTASGYHAVTFGFLVDCIVRQVDVKGRDLKTFFVEEIAEPNGLSVDIGVRKEEAHRIARISTPSLWEFLRDCIKNPRLIALLSIMYARPDDIIWRMQANTKWLVLNYGISLMIRSTKANELTILITLEQSTDFAFILAKSSAADAIDGHFDTISLNDPEILSLSMPAVTGVSTAADLSRLFSLTIDGSILSNTTLSKISSPTLDSWHIEKVTLWPIRKGFGFFYERNPLVPGAFTFGHPGYGGQFVHVDPANQMVLVYLANGLKTGTGELCSTYMRLLRTTYNSLRLR